MLKSIRKEFNKIFNTAKAEKEATMEDKSTQPDLAAQLASALETLASQSTALEAATKQLVELTAVNAKNEKALADSEAIQAALVVEAAAKRLEARTKAVEAAIGTAKAPAMLAATDALNDEQFNAVVDAMAASFDEEAKNPLFKEVGAAASTDATQDAPEETAEMKALKAKYAK